ncbi:MAG: hypothetical protein ABFD10_08025 [Prolixibacteraceae bacterium]
MKQRYFIGKICCCSLLLFLISVAATAQTEIEEDIFMKDTIIEVGLFTSDTLEEAVLSEIQLADFKDKALRKTKALSNYISTIGDKTKDETQRNKAIDLAVGLFMSEDNLVEVSSLNRKENKRFKIRDYLNKIKMLPYNKVTIEWFDIFFSSNFTKRPDNRYEAVATIYQRFSGVTNEGGVYFDITKKNILIIIEQASIETGDRTDKFWEIFLGDIKVEETKKG